MPQFASPLRYPGGKNGLTGLLGCLIKLNGLKDPVYVEPYAGGAGAALSLLFSERVSTVLINDLDPRIAAFWTAVLNQPTRFLRLLDTTPVTVDEWHRQREIYLRPKQHSGIRVGFATFFLNRCNRSGILVTGGPIGGYKQKGKWRIDARFNRQDLRTRIETIVAYKDRIKVSNLDALVFLEKVVDDLSAREEVFVYLDPPYYDKGRLLYLNAYDESDHKAVAKYLKRHHKFKWVLSYDDIAAVRRLYRSFAQAPFCLRYTAYAQRVGNELLICRRDLQVPEHVRNWIAGRNAA